MDSEPWWGAEGNGEERGGERQGIGFNNGSLVTAAVVVEQGVGTTGTRGAVGGSAASLKAIRLISLQ